jgi:hypothetical protein
VNLHSHVSVGRSDNGTSSDQQQKKNVAGQATCNMNATNNDMEERNNLTY